jgi:hypothetical protein
LLGVPAARVDDNRLYRTLDELLPHKEELEAHLKSRLGELFKLDYDLLLYDVTSTYFEGQANFALAQRGYSRDQRSDCKQVCIALVVTHDGMPLGYELFAGNTADVTTVETIVTTMEARHGCSQRIWVMDRGMISEENIEFLRADGRRYIVGTPKPMLKTFEAELLKSDWRQIQAGVEVKLCPAPDGGSETFILCRSRSPREGSRHRAPLRRAHRAAAGGDRRALPQAAPRPAQGRARGRPAVGPEHPGRAPVRRRGHDRRRRPRSRVLDQGQRPPRLGHAQRRLLPIAVKCHRMER